MTTAQDKIGYSRLLPLLVAFLPADRNYPTSAGRWAQAIRNLRDFYGDEYPEMFENITFHLKPGCLPYSREVSEILTRMQHVVLATLKDGYSTYYYIVPEMQAEIREHHSGKVDEETLELIKDMARRLANDEMLALPVA